MWSDGEPIDPSPTIDQAVNGGYGWLEIECSRCNTRRDVVSQFGTRRRHSSTTSPVAAFSKCATVGRRPAAKLLQLATRPGLAGPNI